MARRQLLQADEMHTVAVLSFQGYMRGSTFHASSDPNQLGFACRTVSNAGVMQSGSFKPIGRALPRLPYVPCSST
jgi:hypothetical protein